MVQHTVDPTCTQIGVNQSALVNHRCGQRFPVTQQVHQFVLTMGEAVFSESADCRPKWSATRPLLAGYFGRGHQELLPRS